MLLNKGPGRQQLWWRAKPSATQRRMAFSLGGCGVWLHVQAGVCAKIKILVTRSARPQGLGRRRSATYKTAIRPPRSKVCVAGWGDGVTPTA